MTIEQIAGLSGLAVLVGIVLALMFANRPRGNGYPADHHEPLAVRPGSAEPTGDTSEGGSSE